MQIIATPVPGDHVVSIRADENGLTVDGKIYNWDTLPRDVIVVEYGEYGGVNACSLIKDIFIEVIPSQVVIEHSPAEPIDPAEVLTLDRQGWVCDRWQIKTVLGRERWEVIEGFANSPDAPWGLQTVIDDAMRIPRVSQTVDLLAYILGMSDEDVDALFLISMDLRA